MFEAIYRDWRPFMNFFQPVRKLVEKERVGREVRKRYDRAQTPCQRVLVRTDVDEVRKERLRELYRTLNPVALRRRIEENLEALWRLHG